ncbi:MAG: histidinol dehydrogenase [Acidobacteria bacterium]|nr:histidinol dehydrogenase [Acidobacteriota bacterium]
MIEIVRYNGNVREPRLASIISRQLGGSPEALSAVAAIVEDVRVRGDAALLDATERFDGIRLAAGSLRFDMGSAHELAARVSPDLASALRTAIVNVRAFHECQREASWEIEGENGVVLGQRIGPIDRAGLYVPGGRAAYPSSLIMNAVPAQVAGVGRIVAVTPPNTLVENPALSFVLLELGIDEVYCVGGAQAVAALAFGTETIPKVDKIVGPGNLYVALAKKLVFGTVGIDSIAGPSEIVVLADETANPRWVAADMLSQAEHDEEASAICITADASLAEAVAREVAVQCPLLPRAGIATASLSRYGAIFVVDDLEAGCELANFLAPEHLEIVVRDIDAAAKRIRHAGALFLGPYSAEVVGDYGAGPNHVLPTGGTARFMSPLGVYDFVKRTSVIRYTRGRLESEGPGIVEIAEAEGLRAHATAVTIRMEPST